MYLKIDGVPACETDTATRIWDLELDTEAKFEVSRRVCRCSYSVVGEAELAKRILGEFADVLGIGEISLVDGACPNYNKQGEEV